MWWVFWLGWVTGVNCIGARMDLYGSGEAYAEHVRTHWIDSSISGPIHATLIAVCVWIVWRISRGKRKEPTNGRTKS